MSSDSKSLLTAWIEAFNARDVDVLIDCYHKDAVNFQVAAGAPAVGIDAIRTDSVKFFSAFPDSWAEVENLMSDKSWAAWEWIGGGTFKGRFLGHDPTGRSYEIRGCGFFQFDAGKIVLQRGYWDKLSWFSQIGIR